MSLNYKKLLILFGDMSIINKTHIIIYLIEILFCYIHEFGHYIMARLFTDDVEFRIRYILKIVYEDKKHYLKPYSMCVVWDSPIGVLGNISTILISVAPIVLMCILSFIIGCISIDMLLIFVVFALIGVEGWLLSKTDFNILNRNCEILYLLTINKLKKC